MTNSQVEKRISEQELAQASTFADLQELMNAAYGETVNIANVAGDGFVPLDDKSRLVQTPFIIVTAELHDSEAYGKVAVLRVVTEDNKRYKIRDMSSGIRDQVKTMARTGNILCPNGLRVSNYTFTNDQGKEQSASTYYLAF